MHQTTAGSNISQVTLPTLLPVMILNELIAAGVPEDMVLSGCSLSRSELENEDTRIRYDELLAFIDNALEHYPHTGLGLEIGRKQSISCWGLLGFTMMCQPTLRQALKTGLQYYYTGPAAIDLEIEFDSPTSAFRIYSNASLGHLLPFLVEEMASGVVAVLSQMLGKPFGFSEIHLSYAKPSCWAKYERMFRCPVRFEMPATKLFFDAKLLDHPLLYAHSLSARMTEAACRKAMPVSVGEELVSSDVRRILTRVPGRFPSREEVARELGMSARTLNRMLNTEGTTFQQQLDRVRKDMAIDFMRSSGLPLDNIAKLVGFNEYNNFRKAFKRWAGQPPSAFRPG